MAVVPNDAEPAARFGDGAVILFDGVCNLCSGWVRFAIARDPARRLRFAAMQSPVGQDFLRRRGLPTASFEGVDLVGHGQMIEKSEASFRMVSHLRWPWPLPRALRDRACDCIADSRFRLFGRRSECLVPDPSVADRFIG